MLWEKRYPQGDKFFIKHGPGGPNLHKKWAAGRGPDYVAFIRDYRAAMHDLKQRNDPVRVIGRRGYWQSTDGNRG